MAGGEKKGRGFVLTWVDDFLTKTRVWIDENLQLARGVGMGSLGLAWFLVLRRTKPFYRFRTVGSIPPSYYKRKEVLKGVVTDTPHDYRAHISFFHRPLWDRFSSPQYHMVMSEDDRRAKAKDGSSIKVRIFGVDVAHPEGTEWLGAALRLRPVDISLLYLTGSTTELVNGGCDETVCATVKGRLTQNWRKSDIGTEILSRGLGSVRLDEPGTYASDNLRDIRKLTTLLDKYSNVEQKAKRQKVGMWATGEGGSGPAPRGGLFGGISRVWNFLRRKRGD